MCKPGGDLVCNRDVPKDWWESVWDLAPVPPRKVNHPAPFPEDLPHRLIRMVTRPEDYVMDPFNGAGSTTKAAYDLGRSAVGFEISRTYLFTAESRLTGASSVRAQQLQVVPVKAQTFVPSRSRGRTRHGSGLSARSGGP